MSKPIWVGFTSVFLFFATVIFLPLPGGAEENRVLGVVQKMDAAFNAIEDYTCEVEQVFYKEGEDNQHFRFKFYFKKEKKIRVDFSSPYPALTIFYKEGEKEATVVPLRFAPGLRFRYAIDDPIIHTPTGQWINQTDMGYFIKFLFNNVEKVKQGDSEFYEDKDEIRFWLRALDYIRGKDLEKYRISISKQNWLPIRIERYRLEGKPLEVSMIRNYKINAHLSDKLFIP